MKMCRNMQFIIPLLGGAHVISGANILYRRKSNISMAPVSFIVMHNMNERNKTDV